MREKYKHIKRRTFEIVEKAASSKDTASLAFDWMIIVLIVINILSVILETIPSLAKNTGFMEVLGVVEIVSVIIFTIEYVLRLWSVTTDPKYRHPIFGRLRFALSFQAVVDFLAIAPFYITLFIPFGFDLRFVRIFRLFRFLRLFKLARYSEALKNMTGVLQAKKADILITLSIVILLTLFASSLLYFVEHEAQPHKFSSIPDSMWWAICTLTTVGYGDIFPITWLGKIITAFITLLSVGLIALPAGIIVSGYQDISNKKNSAAQQKERKSIEERLESMEAMLSEIKGSLDSNIKRT
jgi:voltage-gated potassium channel